MVRYVASFAVICCVPLLQGCESVSRFGDSLDPRSSARPTTSVSEPVSATPTPPVSSQPLPPPPPRFTPSTGLPSANPAQVSSPDQIAGGVSQPGGLTAPLAGGVAAPAAGGLTPLPETKIAAATTVLPKKAASTAAPVDTAPEKPSQSRLTGGWSVAQGSGAKCRLTLSNSPALDLYKAQTSGCAAGLTQVTAWELRGDEIYLYGQGGVVAARLKQSGNSIFNGTTAKSGAPVSISK